jgi:hypothetical protein
MGDEEHRRLTASRRSRSSCSSYPLVRFVTRCCSVMPLTNAGTLTKYRMSVQFSPRRTVTSISHEMPESRLLSWDNFYVIVGSSAGALTGLQFVVMALVSDLRKPASSDTIGAFGTPTIVHFSVVLTLSAVLSAPWPSMSGPEWILGVAGAVGLAYVGIVTFRAAQQEGYKPVFEDWLWHTVLPFVSYALLLAGSITMSRNSTPALFMIATMAMLLLLVGIHNAWDTVTFIVVRKSSKAAASESR